MEPNAVETIDTKVVGSRLADARRRRRLTQAMVADELGVARTTIASLESGTRPLRAGELVHLSRLYGVPVSELVRAEPTIAEPDFLVQFRAATRASDTAEVGEDVRRFQRLCRLYVELERDLSAALPRRYPAEYDISGSPIERSAEEVAMLERNRLGLGDGPIGDLWGILESDVGLRIFAVSMNDSKIAGMFVYSDAYGGCIAVNAKHPESRQQWSIAHEYAHFLTQRSVAEISTLAIDFSSS